MNVLVYYATREFARYRRLSSETARRYGGFARVLERSSADLDAGFRRCRAALLALAAARHPVVVRCDARCTLPPDYLRRAVAALCCTGEANVGGRLEVVGATPFERGVAFAMPSRLGSDGLRYQTGAPAVAVDTVPLGAFRRAALAAAGGFDETLARNEDYELNWRLRAAGGQVWFDPALSVAYRPRWRWPVGSSLARTRSCRSCCWAPAPWSLGPG